MGFPQNACLTLRSSYIIACMEGIQCVTITSKTWTFILFAHWSLFYRVSIGKRGVGKSRGNVLAV